MSTVPPLDSQKSTTGLDVRLAGALCYSLMFVTGILFLLVERDSAYVRFHAMQSVLVFGGLTVLKVLLGFVPIIGWLGLLAVVPLTVLLWILLMFKAFQGELFKLPVVGDLAEQRI